MKEIDSVDRDFIKGLAFFKFSKEVKPRADFEKRLYTKLMENCETKERVVKPSFNIFNIIGYKVPFAAAAAFMAIILLVLVLPIITNNNPSQNSQQIAKTTQPASGQFVHYQYLSKPTFDKTVPSSIASPSEYSLKNSLPSASEVLNKSKLSFLVRTAYAFGETYLPVFRANRHEITIEDAKNLAEKFGLSGELKQEGFAPPAYYGYKWEDDKAYLLVSGGSGTGGFDYYLKSPALEGKAPSDDEAKTIATKFLKESGLIDDSYIVSGVKSNVGSLNKITGFNEDHKQVYFRKKVDGYPLYDWVNGSASPINDKKEVWVGVNGRILFAFDSSYWTNLDPSNKTDYLLKEPNTAYEEIKAGKGRLAWIDYDAIGVYTGGYGPAAPTGNFVLHGKLRDVTVEGVDLAYYHEQKGIDEPEFYQPIYIFKAQAALDYKDDYNPSEAEKSYQGKRTTVTLMIPAVSDNYFFENPTTLIEGGIIQQPVAVPAYTLPVQSSPSETQEKHGFVLKLGAVTQKEDYQRDVNLSWEEVPGTVKYNIYLKIAGDKDYSQAALAGVGEFRHTATVNKYIDYYFKVQACKTADNCIESNEVFLSQEQIPNFYMKLGVVTPKEDLKSEVVLSWSEVPETVKYNVFLKNSPTEEYGAALVGINQLTYTATINRYNDNYFMIQACNGGRCYSSNEVFLPKQ